MTIIPEEYFCYLGRGGSKTGLLTVEPGWFQLWGPGELKQRNVDYNVPKCAPGFVGFGSSGGGEIFAFDGRQRVFVLPLADMAARTATLIANSWAEFLAMIEVSNHR